MSVRQQRVLVASRRDDHDDDDFGFSTSLSMAPLSTHDSALRTIMQHPLEWMMKRMPGPLPFYKPIYKASSSIPCNRTTI